ncbi:MAG TPA: TolC family protein [Gammaproteobacteria bacterium]|nr:TolC family protein [Gammaproteobacteria bacterium]
MFTLQTFRCGLGAVLAAAWLWASPAPVAADVLGVEAAVARALAANPGLAALRSRAAALAARPVREGALPEPRLMVNLVNLPLNEPDPGATPMTQLQAGISQVLPYPGKRSLKQAAAEQEAAAAREEVAEERLQLARAVRRSWWEAFYLQRTLEVLRRNDTLLGQFVDIARAKYEVGQGLLQDLSLAEVERAKLREWQLRVQGAQAAARVRLNTLLDRPATTALALPGEVDTTLAPAPSFEVLLVAAERLRPVLHARRHQVDAAQRRLELARKEYYPDFQIAALYGAREGRSDMGSVLFSMNLPLRTGTRQDPLREQRGLELRHSQQQLAARRARVAGDIATALARYRQARAQVLEFTGTLLPQARQTVESMLAAYQVNKVDFLNLVRAQITVYDYETRHWQAFAEARQAQADLAAATGKETVDELFQ